MGYVVQLGQALPPPPPVLRPEWLPPPPVLPAPVFAPPRLRRPLAERAEGWLGKNWIYVAGGLASLVAVQLFTD